MFGFLKKRRARIDLDIAPQIFDLIDQVAYFSVLFERSGDATKGMAARFFNAIAEFFSDDPGHQNRIREQFAASAMRFRQHAHDAVKACSPPPSRRECSL